MTGPNSARATRRGPVAAEPALWGDILIASKDRLAVYHLAVVVDDALQGVTDVVRGRDLLASTSLHRMLQALLDLPAPRYRHHRLVLGGDGAKLSKSKESESLRALRSTGIGRGGGARGAGLRRARDRRLAVALS